MTLPTLLTANTILIAQELARTGASLPAPAPRLVDMPGWAHTCDNDATFVTTAATHMERLCARCGYRAFYTPDGQWLGHHGGNGLIILRRPDHATDLVLTDFADAPAFNHIFGQLVTARDQPYSLIVLSEPAGEPNVFRRATLRGPLSDLDDTPMRAYLEMFRWRMEQTWTEWRRQVFDSLALPIPLDPGEPAFSDWDGHEEGSLDDGRGYVLHASVENDPHLPWIGLSITGEHRDWFSSKRSVGRAWQN